MSLKYPLIDLHCHLDGSLPLSIVQELLGRPVRIEELQIAQDCRSLAQYLEKFEIPLQCLQTPAGLEKVAFHFLEEVAKDGVNYIEIRFAPMLSVHDTLSCKQVIESVVDGCKRGKEAFGVSSNVIVCAMRHHSEEQNMQMIHCAKEFYGVRGVCALDLAGNEAAYPMKQFRDLFAMAKRMGLPFTIHAGECGSVENIREAIAYGAKRIGHGIAMSNDKELQELCVRNKIGVEMCPSSNLQTKAIAEISHYPLKEFLQRGILATINTDNRTVSNTTIYKEIELVRKYCGLKEDDIEILMKNALEVSFTDDDEKERLVKQV
ncbi:MAG: adenosine deaminase [Lachnotalea sp.]